MFSTEFEANDEPSDAIICPSESKFIWVSEKSLQEMKGTLVFPYACQTIYILAIVRRRWLFSRSRGRPFARLSRRRFSSAMQSAPMEKTLQSPGFQAALEDARKSATVSVPSRDDLAPVVRTRKLFPETWLWTEVDVPYVYVYTCLYDVYPRAKTWMACPVRCYI